MNEGPNKSRILVANKRMQRTRLELSLVVISILGQFQLLGEPRPRGPFYAGG